MYPLSAFCSAKFTSTTNVPPGWMVVAVRVVKPPPVMSSLPRRFSVVALTVPVVLKVPPESIVRVGTVMESIFRLPPPETDTVSRLVTVAMSAVPLACTLSVSVPAPPSIDAWEMAPPETFTLSLPAPSSTAPCSRAPVPTVMVALPLVSWIALPPAASISAPLSSAIVTALPAADSIRIPLLFSLEV